MCLCWVASGVQLICSITSKNLSGIHKWDPLAIGFREIGRNRLSVLNEVWCHLNRVGKYKRRLIVIVEFGIVREGVEKWTEARSTIVRHVKETSVKLPRVLIAVTHGSTDYWPVRLRLNVGLVLRRVNVVVEASEWVEGAELSPLCHELGINLIS